MPCTSDPPTSRSRTACGPPPTRTATLIVGAEPERHAGHRLRAVDQEGDPFDSALATIVDACKRHDVIAGIHANAGLAAKRHASGFRMITVGMDAAPATAALRADAASARPAIGAGSAQGADGDEPAEGSGKVY